ncbi:DNA ligase 1-like [Venturia canescens]|uniref:DNA ligase 1-like n=1 Tax=Venturia canescens TaxID=32260 RepID=UPI001C9BFC47|nr:DNA ligase 1-like [Venturia canescens]
MDSTISPDICDDNLGIRTKSILSTPAIKQTKEKPALSPIEEETDSSDTSADSGTRNRDNENVTALKKHSYDIRIGLRNDYEQLIGNLEEEIPKDKIRLDESPPFLTARNTSDHKGQCCDSSATTSNERNSEDEEEEEEIEEEEEDSSVSGESTSGDVDYYCEENYQGNALETPGNDDLENVANDAEENSLVSSRKKVRTNRRPKSAPSSYSIEASSDPRRDHEFNDVATILDWLKTRLVKSERDIDELKNQLDVEKLRGRKLARRYEDDQNLMRENLRIDLESWIKKLNDGLKSYLGEWQKRERLRINEEISRISDLYSQEITKGLKITFKEWQAEDMKSIIEVIDSREKSRDDKEKLNAKLVYEKIQTHLENLEKRNRKSYATLSKHIDKWEDRLRDEIVKLHEEDLKKLRQEVNIRCEESKRSGDSSTSVRSRKEKCTEIKRSSSFLGDEALLQVEENLLKRLRESSTKDFRRTEQIVRTELKSQRRELGKRMNEKISELWLAFEEFGSYGSSKIGRNDLEDHRGSVIANRSKDPSLKPDIAGARWGGEKIVRLNQPGGESSFNNSDVDEDADRDYDEDEDESTGRSSGRNEDALETPVPSTPPSRPSIKTSLVNKNSCNDKSANRGQK